MFRKILLAVLLTLPFHLPAQEAAPEETDTKARTRIERTISTGILTRVTLYMHETTLNSKNNNIPFDINAGIMVDGNIGLPFSFYFQSAIFMPLKYSNISFYNTNGSILNTWTSNTHTRSGFMFDTTLGLGYTFEIKRSRGKIHIGGGLHLAYMGHYIGDITNLQAGSLNFFLFGGSMTIQFILPLAKRTDIQLAAFVSADSGISMYRGNLGYPPFVIQSGIAISFAPK